MTRWYPIECEHGYDACPICDGPRPEDRYGNAIPPMKPGDTMIDGDLTLTVGTWQGITFIDRPIIENEPARPNVVDNVTSHERVADTCVTVTAPESQQSLRK